MPALCAKSANMRGPCACLHAHDVDAQGHTPSAPASASGQHTRRVLTPRPHTPSSHNHTCTASWVLHLCLVLNTGLDYSGIQPLKQVAATPNPLSAAAAAAGATPGRLPGATPGATPSGLMGATPGRAIAGVASTPGALAAALGATPGGRGRWWLESVGKSSFLSLLVFVRPSCLGFVMCSRGPGGKVGCLNRACSRR